MKTKLISGLKFLGAAMAALIFIALYVVGVTVEFTGDAVAVVGKALKSFADGVYNLAAPL